MQTPPPTVTNIVSSPADGQLANGDTLIITFRKPLNPASLPQSPIAGATESRTGKGPMASDVMLNIPGITQGALDTRSKMYLMAGAMTFNPTATFSAAVALDNNGASTTVTLTVSTLSTWSAFKPFCAPVPDTCVPNSAQRHRRIGISPPLRSHGRNFGHPNRPD